MMAKWKRKGEMVSKTITGVICACLTFVSINVNALLIDSGGYINDTNAGLDWLHSSYTIGKSYYQAAGGFNTYLDGGWRYATNEEVENIFSQIFDGFYANTPYGYSSTHPYYASTTPPYANQLADIHAFQSLFGYVQNGSGVTTERFTYGLYGDEYIRNGYGGPGSQVHLLGAYDGSLNESAGYNTEVYGPDFISGTSPQSAWYLNFTFAVRAHCEDECDRAVYNVPEPSIAFLMTSGLIAFGLVRRIARS